MARNVKTFKIKIKNEKTEMHVIYRSQLDVHFYKFMTNFANMVLEVIKRIPKGETKTYKEIAVAVGRPKAWRAVGNVLNKNFDPKIPCHRVVRSDSKIGGYNRGVSKKRLLLKNEKII